VPAVKIKGTGVPEQSLPSDSCCRRRGSLARKWADLASSGNDQPFLFAGVFLQDVATTRDGFLYLHPDLGFVVGMVPQAKAGSVPIWDTFDHAIPLHERRNWTVHS